MTNEIYKQVHFRYVPKDSPREQVFKVTGVQVQLLIIPPSTTYSVAAKTYICTYIYMYIHIYAHIVRYFYIHQSDQKCPH